MRSARVLLHSSTIDEQKLLLFSTPWQDSLDSAAIRLPAVLGRSVEVQLITPLRHFLAKFSSRLVDLSLVRLESLLTSGESCTPGAIPRHNDGLLLENI